MVSGVCSDEPHWRLDVRDVLLGEWRSKRVRISLTSVVNRPYPNTPRRLRFARANRTMFPQGVGMQASVPKRVLLAP